VRRGGGGGGRKIRRGGPIEIRKVERVEF